MSDFVAILSDAYNESPQKIMGDDFNFKTWCDNWLISSGINILQPIVKYEYDHSISSLTISYIICT